MKEALEELEIALHELLIVIADIEAEFKKENKNVQIKS